MQANEVLAFIEENDVKFIRLAYTDLFGQLKNLAILPDRLADAFGAGVAIDETASAGFGGGAGGDLLLKPDPNTLCILPWRPQSGRVCRLLCEVSTADGGAYTGDCRALLRRAVARAADMGLQVRVGTDCEFYLFDLDESGRLTYSPHDEGGYMDVAPLDRSEDVRRDICLTLEQMGIRPESSHHERGPGQNEVDFHRADPLNSADHFVEFVHAVRAVSTRYGVHATFIPKPIAGEAGNGLHVKLALYRGQRNLMRMENGGLCAEAKSAMAGVLKRLPELSLFMNPLPNSYNRLGDEPALCRAAWSFSRGRGALRVPLPQESFARMELGSPDPAMNVYLGFALIINAALDGVERGLELPPEGEIIGALPKNLTEAAKLAEHSDFVRDTLPEEALERYIERARELVDECAGGEEAQKRSQILRY